MLYSFALGFIMMTVAYAVSALVHFKGPVAPSAGRVFRQAGRAVILRFAILIIGVMLTLRYFAAVNQLFLILGILVAQQANWIALFWRTRKGKD